jgi:hypothetical protein
MSQSLLASNVTDDLYQPNVEQIKKEPPKDVKFDELHGEPKHDVEDMTHRIKKVRKQIPFWGENPNILFHQLYMFEFFPVEGMSYEQKLNAISRSVLVLTIISFVVSKNVQTILFSLVTLGAIYMLNHYHKQQKQKMVKKKQANEGFENAPIAEELFRKHNLPVPDGIFDGPESSNPFGNVLVTDYDYNPEKKPAPPAFNKNVEQDILKQAKQFVVDANPDHPNIADKLFKDAGSELMFEQSLRPFNSNPSTTIPNDQAGFAEFCYGSMISCKEGNQFACARNLSRHTN